MSEQKGTRHYKIQEMSSLLMIISFPFMLYGLLNALPEQASGIEAWLSKPFGAISLFVFYTSAILYCKQAFDDVLLDYAHDGLLRFGLMANRIVAILMWAIVTYCIFKLWLGA